MLTYLCEQPAQTLRPSSHQPPAPLHRWCLRHRRTLARYACRASRHPPHRSRAGSLPAPSTVGLSLRRSEQVAEPDCEIGQRQPPQRRPALVRAPTSLVGRTISRPADTAPPQRPAQSLSGLSTTRASHPAHACTHPRCQPNPAHNRANTPKSAVDGAALVPTL